MGNLFSRSGNYIFIYVIWTQVGEDCPYNNEEFGYTGGRWDMTIHHAGPPDVTIDGPGGTYTMEVHRPGPHKSF